MREDVYFSQNNGLPIFALIKANSKEQAILKANSLLEETTSNDVANNNRYHSTKSKDEQNTAIHQVQVNGPFSTPDYIDTTFSAYNHPESGDEENEDGNHANNTPR